MDAKDSYGSPPETKDRMQQQQLSEPQMRTFAPVTPSSASGSRDGRTTSARATRGRNTSSYSSQVSQHSRSSYNSGCRSSRTSPRMLLVSPAKDQTSHTPETTLSPGEKEQQHKQQQEQAQQQQAQQQQQQEPLLFNLPPSLLPHWCSLLICSALSLAAVAAGTPLTTSSSNVESSNAYEDMQMVMAIATLSVMLTFASVACYILIPASFVGTLYEVTVIGLNIVLWSGALPIIMNPDNNLAVQGASIVNGNLFVLSWVSFFLSWVVLKLVLEQLHVMNQARSGNLAYLTPYREGYPPLIPLTFSRMIHIGLVFSCLVVLVSAARNHKQEVCHDWNRQLCKRLKFIITLAVMTLTGQILSWIVGFILIRRNKYNGNHNPAAQGTISTSPAVRLGLKGLQAFGWFLVTGISTFGQHAPGHALGNLFLAVWTSFGLTLCLLKKAWLEYVATKARTTNNTSRRSSLKKKMGEQFNKRQTSSSNKKKLKIPGLVLDERDEEDPSTVAPSISMKATDESVQQDDRVPLTPGLVTPKTIPGRPHSQRSHRSAAHSTIAMSLEESFVGKENRYDIECGGSLISICKTPTERTLDDEEDDEDSVQTPRRGSAKRSTVIDMTTPNTDYRTCKSNLTGGTIPSREHLDSPGNPEDREELRPKPTPTPFGPPDESMLYDEDYDDNGLSTSAVTTAIDNTTGGSGRDVLIDPDDF